MTDIPIKDKQLKVRAFTHRSYLNETNDESFTKSNERLEFLGDAVLELVVSKFLFDKFPDRPEGELTALRAALVKTTTLAQVAAKLDLGSKLLMSRGESQSGGRDNQHLLANTFESVVGALYLDQGVEAAENFISTHLLPLIDEIIANDLHKDFKSTFQERVQADGHPTPVYKAINEDGPDHDKTFTVALFVSDTQVATGKGSSKQRAQQQAAKEGLQKLDTGLSL